MFNSFLYVYQRENPMNSPFVWLKFTLPPGFFDLRLSSRQRSQAAPGRWKSPPPEDIWRAAWRWVRGVKKHWSLWWFQTFFIFHDIWYNPSHWLVFFKMVKTTNQIIVYNVMICVCMCTVPFSSIHTYKYCISAGSYKFTFAKQGSFCFPAVLQPCCFGVKFQFLGSVWWY